MNNPRTSRRGFLQIGVAGAASTLTALTANGQETRFRKKTYTYKRVGKLEIKADVHRADDDVKRSVVVWIHGGALINAVVPGGPADKAGLQAGDVITAIGDQNIREGHDLLRTVLRHGVGERLRLDVRRGEKTKKVTLVTGEPQSLPATKATP